MNARLVAMALAMFLFANILLFAGAAGAEASVSTEIVDTGYRPWTHGFSFQNFGDPEVYYGIDLGAVLGSDFHDEIFRHTGHCYGMASASVDDFLANRTPADQPIDEAMPCIDRIQTDQSFYYIAEYARFPFGGKALDNRAEYEKIIERLKSGKPAVIGVYYSAGGHPGHAVVAYRADVGENETRISVYDPNLPPAMYPYVEAPLTAVYYLKNGSFQYDNGQPFDQVRLNDLDASGIAAGRALAASLASLPGALLFLLLMRRFPPGL
ncbi:hypothetical protein [Methanocella arvoryzae]|uniref:Uncharacterized protein n=1 Tax=Methanocella arvoryzae (strain DSM 22066 / NBRC 105507 / MRE50) TaxID=351160 RepID=Q0W5A7_METAR|nr:hypothetical protein [Methanocella arvoryzae]CAJ36436.1 hypothetical protein RCIX1127 [Methanocella arvoryzae MRE50]